MLILDLSRQSSGITSSELMQMKIITITQSNCLTLEGVAGEKWGHHLEKFGSWPLHHTLAQVLSLFAQTI